MKKARVAKAPCLFAFTVHAVSSLPMSGRDGVSHVLFCCFEVSPVLESRHDASNDRQADSCKLMVPADAIATRALAYRSPTGALHQNTHASVVVSTANGPPSVAL